MITKDREKSRLLESWRYLGAAERETLIKFAEFLRTTQPQPPDPISQTPLNLARPDGESAVKALKRLKKNYPMIDADVGLLDAASRLLMEKISGTPDNEVIDKMEKLFLGRYQSWQSNRK